MEKVLVELLRAEQLLEDGGALRQGDHMQDLVEEPNAFGGGHSVVDVHEDLDRTEEEQVVELRRDELLVLVDGCEPRSNEL